MFQFNLILSPIRLNYSCNLNKITSCIRMCSSKIDSTFKRPVHESNSPSPAKNYIKVYRFPYINLCSLASKAKWPLAIMSGVSLPVVTLLYLTGHVELATVFSVSVTVLSWTVAFFVAGQLFHRLVGFVYLSEDGEMVKVSYLNFWGNRVDEEFCLDDLRPLSEPEMPPTKLSYKRPLDFFYPYRRITEYFYRRLERVSSNKILKINTRWGVVEDCDKFIHVFRSLPD